MTATCEPSLKCFMRPKQVRGAGLPRLVQSIARLFSCSSHIQPPYGYIQLNRPERLCVFSS